MSDGAYSPPSSNGFSEYKYQILDCQRRHAASIEKLTVGQAALNAVVIGLATKADVQFVRDDVNKLKTQSAMWGTIAGLVASVMFSVVGGLIQWLLKGGSTP